MSGDLRSCPFCGSDEIEGVIEETVRTWCARCGCDGPVDGSEQGVTWNTRAPDPAVAALEAEVARLREALQPFADAAEHLHPVHPDNGMTLDGIRVSAWRAAWSALNPAPSEKEAG